jgi:hypothetical protein
MVPISLLYINAETVLKAFRKASDVRLIACDLSHRPTSVWRRRSYCWISMMSWLFALRSEAFVPS